MMRDLIDEPNHLFGDKSDPENTSWVDIPEEYYIPNNSHGISRLINFIYDDDTLYNLPAAKLQGKAIVCSKNDVADVINAKILSLLPDIVDRVYEMKIHQFIAYLRDAKPFEKIMAGPDDSFNTVFCAIEQNRIDYVREHQNDIRNEYLSSIYDAISRGDNNGSNCGSRLILPQSSTGGPRYMYSRYLDASAICRVH
nr:DNA helicase [Tanacetum cinerariifolium]